ncbi:hypothetical protein ACM46_15645 [Chryseobacterium angstadtii]|uniref:Uncharacterized protein n=1 Tax=Chryseobacterium angstadtii TaxID=558151 RepID=A0A0J7I698_9FLAO|nr:hypothetical protein [Chryseobacterium angstadtii]KMQ61449.1 hypothetical protein ACM46_15645 [Chryseobacterium angstadtii]
MGQDITCLITDKNLELNRDIVHFKVQGFTFIPFNTSCDLGLEEAKDFEFLKDYIRYLESRDSFENYTYNRDNDHCDIDIFRMIKNYQIENFIIEHHSEWADIPVDYYFMQVTEGRIVKNSLVFDESEQSKTNKAHVPESKRNFGLHFDWLANTDLFYSYFHADRVYTLLQKK